MRTLTFTSNEMARLNELGEKNESVKAFLQQLSRPDVDGTQLIVCFLEVLVQKIEQQNSLLAKQP